MMKKLICSFMITTMLFTMIVPSTEAIEKKE